MAKRPFPTNPNYLESIGGLHELHQLAAAGQDEGPEADVIRDRLERPWAALSEVERRRITGLSEDLYSISEPPRPATPVDAESQVALIQALVEMFEARQAGEWDKALELLRHWGRYLTSFQLSSLRGAIWDEAGDPATAALFFDHAARCQALETSRSGTQESSQPHRAGSAWSG